ncbi:MAG: secretin N-terminal domain-containing protein [Planctomycetota bacterium]|jgi:hypothetical protein
MKSPDTIPGRAAVLLMTAHCLLAGTAAAQAPSENAPDLGEAKVITLEHGDANDIGVQVMELIPGPHRFRLTVDERTNSLIFAAVDAPTLDFVRNVVRMLDVEVESSRAGEDGLVTRVFTLAHAADGYELVDLIDSLFQQRQERTAADRRVRLIAPPRLAFDAQSGQVIARGLQEDLDAVSELIAALDVAVAGKADAPARGEMQIRLVWLVGGLEEGLGRSVPADLRPVTEQLRRLGIEGLRQVSQVLLRVSAGEQFQSAFHAELGAGWRMAMKGSAGGTETARRLEIEIEGSAATGFDGAAGSGRLLELSTSITTAPDHFVVLGVSPIGPMDSVFVVQIREQ